MTIPSLEAEIRQALGQNRIQYKEYTDSYTESDFVFTTPFSGRAFHLELKEKRQRINTAAWPRTGIPEPELFILDDLTARKLLRHAPDSGVLVRDNLRRLYVFYSIAHLLTIPKVRTNRHIQVNGGMKGKWLIDLRHGIKTDSIVRALLAVERYIEGQEHIFTTSPLWGAFEGERTGTGGTPRTSAHIQNDWGATR
jgi:hypothetical protein